jgi:hypothetical protein
VTDTADDLERMRVEVTAYYDASYPPSILGADPHISTLTPNTVAASAGPVTVTVTGTNFSAASVVEVNQAAQVTAYVSPTVLTISYDPTVAATVMFTVRDGAQESNSVPFVVTAGELELEAEAEGEVDTG